MISIILLALNTIYFAVWTTDMIRFILTDKVFLPDYLSPVVPAVLFLVIAIIGAIENKIKYRPLLKKTNRIAVAMFFLSFLIIVGITITLVDMMSKVIG